MTEEQPSPPKARRGCLFYGCLTGVVCLVAILVAFLLGLHLVKKMLNEYTDSKPMPLPAVQMAPAQVAAVRQRVDNFRDAIRAGRTTPPLELTPQEINALLANDPEVQGLRDRIYVTDLEAAPNGDKFKAQISYPMAQLGLPLFHNRFLNGTGTFSISFQNGLLQITPREIEVKGKPLPSVYLDRVRSENLAAQANDNARASVALNKLQSIQVKDGKLVIVPKDER